MEDADCDVLVVGAGFAGMYAVHRLRSDGFSVTAVEAAADVGGTWWWNRYPGARCDVESLEYSYGFDDELQQSWRWSERYAAQPELLDYANHVADRFDLRRDVSFDTRVTAATWGEVERTWTVTTQRVAQRSVHGDVLAHEVVTRRARFVVMATGCLSAANVPDIAGIDAFEAGGGTVLHTGRWPHDGVDMTGRRVAVIGTGSSGVQAIPQIAADATQLTVFQRTATYAAPAHNAPLDDDAVAAVTADYPGFRAALRKRTTAFGASYPPAHPSALAVSEDERDAILEERWRQGGFAVATAFADLLVDAEANERVADFVRRKIRSIVEDPVVADALCPTQTIACKRMCVDTGYYETFNRSHVELVSVADDPIAELTASGITLTSGASYDVDTVVFATGYDAMTGSLDRIDIRGVDDVTLRDAWAAGPRTLLGLAVPGIPNLFTVTGPGSPSVLSNMIVAIEQHVEWIAGCLTWLREHGRERIEATEAAADRWVAHVNAIADLTLSPSCNSWDLGAIVPGKPRVFMPVLGFPAYAAECERVAATDYDGFDVR